MATWRAKSSAHLSLLGTSSQPLFCPAASLPTAHARTGARPHLLGQVLKVAPGQNALGPLAEVGQKQEGPHSPTQVSASLWLWSATLCPLLAWPGRPLSCISHFLPVLCCLALCLLPAGLPAALAPALSWRPLSWCNVKLFCVTAVRAPQAGVRSFLVGVTRSKCRAEDRLWVRTPALSSSLPALS